MKIQCDTTISVLTFFPIINIVSPAELMTGFEERIIIEICNTHILRRLHNKNCMKNRICNY